MSGYLNGKEAPSPNFRRQGGRNPVRHMLPGLIIVIGAVAAWYFIIGRGRQPSASQTDMKAKPAAESRAPKPAAVKQAVTATSAEKSGKPESKQPEKPKNDPRYPYTDGRTVLSSRTNGWNEIIDICRMPDGTSRKVVRPARRPWYTNAADQMLVHALSGTMDEDLPPLPLSDNLEADFVESLKTPIVINDDDSEAVKESKRRVIAAREYIDGEMRKGRGFREVLAEHAAQRKSNSEAREQAMEIVSELKASGDVEMLNEYVQQVNEMFRERDIGEISADGRPKGGNEDE